MGGSVDKGAARGVVGGDVDFDSQVFHVAVGAFRGGGTLDDLFEVDGKSSSRSVRPVLSCDIISRENCHVNVGG